MTLEFRQDRERPHVSVDNKEGTRVIARARSDVESIQPPTGGRAPAWQTGLVVRTDRPSRRRPPATRKTNGPLTA